MTPSEAFWRARGRSFRRAAGFGIAFTVGHMLLVAMLVGVIFGSLCWLYNHAIAPSFGLPPIVFS